MKKLLCFSLLMANTFWAAAQADSTFTDAGAGILYKIISKGQGQPMKPGSFFEFKFKQVYKDSLLFNSDEFANQVSPYDSASIPGPIFKVFGQCRPGDEVIIKVLTDSAFRDQPVTPPFAKGEYFVSYYSIINVFSQRAQADSVMSIQNAIAEEKMKKKEEQQMVIDEKIIKDYFAKNNIKNTVRTPSGVYVETKQAGTGKKVDAVSKVKVNYTGRTLGGETFDSNIDPKFQHVEPFTVDMATGGVIKGWLDALPYFSKGTKGTVYIPSPLGYGTRGAGADIAPNAILVFDIQVLEITGAKPAPVKKAPVKKAPVKAKAKAGKN